MDKISYHDSIRRLYEKIKKDGITNVWDRYTAQGMGGDPDKRCSFCEAGTRCDLCSNGPCRADAAKDKRGVCGITADGMVMRMMLLRNVMGAATYQYHTDQTVQTLRATAEGETLFALKEPAKVKDVAQRLGIAGEGSPNDIALALCDFVETDFNRKYNECSQIVEKLAPQERKTLWNQLGIFPGGIYHELMVTISSCLTNVDGYYVSLALKALRLGVAMAYESQIITEYFQDIIFGVPRPHGMRVDLGVLDHEYVNVIPNGHEPFLGFAMVQLARTEAWQQKARKVGAKGLRVIASIETGQEMIQRWDMDDVFYGFTGNWIAQEAVLASGCIDLFAADMNCSLPVDPVYAQKYQFSLVPVSELVAFEGIKDRITYNPKRVEQQAAHLLELAVSNFAKRKSVAFVTGLPQKEAVVGFSTESILEALGGSLDPLITAIKEGHIRGVVGMVSCSALRDTGQDVHTVRVVKELIKRDMLVLSLGCGNGAVQVAGLCSVAASKEAGPGLKAVCDALKIPPVLSYGTCTDTGRLADLLKTLADVLGVPVPDLPVAAAAPEYMEQKATIDALFALALGLYTYVNPVPPVTGAPNLVTLLTKECKNITGGLLTVEKDFIKAVDNIAAHIEAKRKALGMR
jgi:carbon-monoxide dehydrogenase catalytic subunit